MSEPVAASIGFDRDGLVPVVVQDVDSGDVLMLAFMNEEALRLTSLSGEAHYWSRSRGNLWRKGETSGHTQSIAEIRVNCERNSVLLLVRQTGSVCHDGYPTCYYRRVSEDGALEIVREQAFDPVAVYGRGDRPGETIVHVGDEALVAATRRQFGAYAFLKENDHTASSATSRRLRAEGTTFSGRIADELRELSGVLAGSHRHTDPTADLRLEASQVLYWVIIEALRLGVSWADVRPDKALGVSELAPDPRTVVRLLGAEADRWAASNSIDDFATKAHAALALVALACRSGGLDPLKVVTSDLEGLRARPYLVGYFGREEAVYGRDVEGAGSSTG